MEGPILTNKKGIILWGSQTYDVFANHMLTNISYGYKPAILVNPLANIS